MPIHQKVPGVLLNDSVRVTCTHEDIDGVKILKADELTITVHSPYYYIQGTWLEPNPINLKEMQGFTLNQNGTAQFCEYGNFTDKKLESG